MCLYIQVCLTSKWKLAPSGQYANEITQTSNLDHVYNNKNYASVEGCF